MMPLMTRRRLPGTRGAIATYDHELTRGATPNYRPRRAQPGNEQWTTDSGWALSLIFAGYLVIIMWVMTH